ncbi:hypothetical protein [Nakamurella aerolata]|uniref:Uncharacterized protein n=1 Tax=Nakamurella aerolata TaxID=1656892 RepID=A0A849A7K4_9ACTN|nr:hypothetical protein [Nakamurella aerolata]NNG36964.1 hypothetical protein [Nakamurella aerolata]
MPWNKKLKNIRAAAAAAGAAVIVVGTAGAAAGTVPGVAVAEPAAATVQLAAAGTSDSAGSGDGTGSSSGSSTGSSSGPSSSSGSSGAESGGAAAPDAPDAPKPGKELSTTALTGAEVDKVVAAVKAKDGAVTVAGVTKLADGSFRAAGTKAGEPVLVDVSKDLATVTVRSRGSGGLGGPGGPGGPGGHGRGPGAERGTDVTGDQLSKITAAVKSKDSAVTLQRVVKVDDGSYVGFGSKGSGDAATRVRVTISGDLKTIAVQTPPERPDGGKAPGDH